MKAQKEKLIVEFLAKNFPNEEMATVFFVEKRWGNNIKCTYCESERIYNIKGIQPFKCGECNKKFTVKTGTIIEGSHIDIRIWLVAMYIIGTSRKGISSIQLAKQLGTTQKTAWFMAQRIHEACNNKNQSKEIFEVNEVCIGEKEKDKHAYKRFYTECVEVKIPVVGMKERGGKVMVRVVNNTSSQTLQGLIQENVMQKSAVMAEGYYLYQRIENGEYKHRTVKHSVNTCVDGVVNTNNAESFWTLLRRRLCGAFHIANHKHLQRCIDEFVFCISNNNTISYMKADSSMIKYKNLTA